MTSQTPAILSIERNPFSAQHQTLMILQSIYRAGPSRCGAPLSSALWRHRSQSTVLRPFWENGLYDTNDIFSLFTLHAIIVAFSIVAGLPIVAKFGHNQLCVYMALLIIRTRALYTTK